MKKLLLIPVLLLALSLGAVNVTNYPLTNDFTVSEWFLLSSVPLKTNLNLPGDRVAKSADLTSLTARAITNGATVSNLYFVTVIATNLVIKDTNGGFWRVLVDTNGAITTTNYP